MSFSQLEVAETIDLKLSIAALQNSQHSRMRKCIQLAVTVGACPSREIMRLALEDQVHPLWTGMTPNASQKSMGGDRAEEVIHCLLEKQAFLAKRPWPSRGSISFPEHRSP
ncbi:MAG TPA: hypothetical protein DCZ69_03505 [Syntrophobacteraceae bacterium]|nr:hypothetical protein [Syntrophobacteraceae bacterium]